MSQRRRKDHQAGGWAMGLALISTLAASCATPVGSSLDLRLPEAARRATGATGPVGLIRTPGSASVTLAEAADELQHADVVFLGEQHDNAEGHAVQLALTQALAERRGSIVLSMEMFERDAQASLDLYLAGALSEEGVPCRLPPLAQLPEHYRAAVEFCRERGHSVLAANVFRPIASRVAQEGLAAAAGDAWAARDVYAPASGEYRRRFAEVMGSHGDGMDTPQLDRIFAAQCIKDDTMAESIAGALAPNDSGEVPQVVHWNGRFHSDFGSVRSSASNAGALT